MIAAARVAGDKVRPLGPADLDALTLLEGREVYVISAAELDEVTVRQQAYVEALEAAPWWVATEEGR